ncbi:MAG: DUF4349 domain-containing protein [Clostridia bacterium]|nr:DUF4349 domain-containing protein [Clostridia bacterium]
MDCRKFLEQLDAFIDGELTPGAKAAMENHMNNCPECKKLYEDAKEILMKTNELNDVKAPEGFTDAVMEKLQNEPAPKKPLPKWAKWTIGAAAGFVGVCVLGVGLLAGGSLLFGAKAYDSATTESMTYYSTGSTTSASMMGGTAADKDMMMNAAAMDAGETADMIMPEPMEAEVAMEEAELGFTSTTADTSSGEQYGLKIIRNGDINLQSVNFDQDIASIENAIKASGGYVLSSSTSGQPVSETGSKWGRDANYTAKIPAQAFYSVVDIIKECGTLQNYYEYSDDITSQYYDTQTRLDAYHKQYEKIEALLDKADNLTDIITIQQELTELQYKIDSLTGQIKKWDNQVSYSTLYIYIQEVRDPSSIKDVDPTLGERIREGFFDGVNDIIEGGENVIVWFASSALSIVIVVLIIGAAVLIIRKIHLRNKKK